MGQAWCKEKSNQAQDSKSPLDRVFLRCAHRIYPGLKEEGSVLGGATQRVTSSEIGYASSPSREVLTRGQSIDSVDRPFHPSDWVDVNLEVPVTPRTSTVMTSQCFDRGVHQPPSYSSANFTVSRDVVPVPPPRRKKKNRGRPLPPKPDDLPKTHVDRNLKCSNPLQKGQEPFYSSVKLPRNWSNDKEIIEHKVNGTGRVIPSIAIAASRSSREKTSREPERNVERKDSRRKNSSTTSLPNYLDLEIGNAKSSGDGDNQEAIRVLKITGAGSLPALITSGALENLKKTDNRKGEENSTMGIEVVDGGDEKRETDEVDFSFHLEKPGERKISKSENLGLTSTPVKIGYDSGSVTTIGGWFLHRDRTSGSFSPIETPEPRKVATGDCSRDVFKVDENRLNPTNDKGERDEEKLESERRSRLKRSLSKERGVVFEGLDEKDLERGEIDETILRSNAEVELLARTISEESLPREMLENEETDFFEEKVSIPSKTYERGEWVNEGEPDNSRVESSIEGDTKTPPPSPEPRITPEILDNDHSSRLKVVLRDEESNLSSMTPSLTELEAALSDMLERDDEPILPHVEHSDNNEKKNSTERKIVSEITVSLTNILDASKDETSPPMMDVDLTNDEKNSSHPGLPPEKPCRLSQTSREEASGNSINVPTPPKRRNRYGGYTSSILDGTSLERTATPENPYPNDRLI